MEEAYAWNREIKLDTKMDENLPKLDSNYSGIGDNIIISDKNSFAFPFIQHPWALIDNINFDKRSQIKCIIQSEQNNLEHDNINRTLNGDLTTIMKRKNSFNILIIVCSLYF